MENRNGDYCSQCPKKDGCKEVYEKLAQSDAPSVLGKVLLAFLLPIVVFVGLLIGLDFWLPEFEGETLRSLVVFAVSATVTFAVVWLLKYLRQRKRT